MTYPAAADELLNKRVGSKQNSSLSTTQSSYGIAPAKIKKIIKQALVQLPNLTTVAVVEMATGTCLAYESRLRKFDPAAAAAYHAELVRQQQLAMESLGMRGERLEDILIPLRKNLHLIRLSKNAQWLVFLVVKAQDTSLALAREILKSITA